MQNLENLKNFMFFQNKIYLRSPPVVPPEVGREPRGARPIPCIAWFASIDTISKCDFDQHRVDRCVCLSLKSSTPRGGARFSKGDLLNSTQFVQF